MKKFDFDYKPYKKELMKILTDLSKVKNLSWRKLRAILSENPKDGNKIFSKNHLVMGYKGLVTEGLFEENPQLFANIQKKPIRTESGIVSVTVLTKPFPCPGKCIFCPNDIRMPKSYLRDEPGAQRAERNMFDPYLQTFNRLKALEDIGHNTEKIEMIILGGTWSYYPEAYQIWFIKRCFEAMNDFGDSINQLDKTYEEAKALDITADDLKIELVKEKSYNKLVSEINTKSGMTEISKKQRATWEELFAEHKRNETNRCRNVGLVIETRPDNISPEEIIRVRKLGCTKTQIGFQSLNDEVLDLNHRGHNVEATRKAVALARWGGFKIHAHWMANLYGSTPEKDIEDYKKLFSDKDFRPDELKIYPCSLIETAELMDYFKAGKWKPFSFDELLKVLVESLKNTPEYCRLTRIIRDIPSTDIVEGNKMSNFRQIVELEMDKLGIERKDIRSREIKKEEVSRDELELKIIEFDSSIGKEKFLQFVRKTDNKIAGFLRLSLPDFDTSLQSEVGKSGGEAKYKHPFIPELDSCAMIREIHVYGKVVGIGKAKEGKAQHLGLGKELIEKAIEISKKNGYEKLAVISAVGTREYYRKRGFKDGTLFQITDV